MKNKEMAILDQKNKLVVVFLFLLVVLLAILSYLKFRSNRVVAPTKDEISVQGQIIDSVSREPIPGLMIKIAEEQEITDSKGQFKFEDVPPQSSLVIQGQGIYGGMEVAVNNRDKFTIYLNQKLLSLIDKIERYEKKRDYASIYEFFSRRVRSKYTEDEYLSAKNRWRDRIVDEHGYQNFELDIIESSITPTRNDIVHINAIYKWSAGEGDYDEYPYQMKFVHQNGVWQLENDLIFGQEE